MQKVIVIIGATATGKSTLAYQLAKDIDAEIINTDAYQVYQELNAGVNKIESKKRKEIIHHFIDSHSIYNDFDIKIFQDLARKKIEEINAKNKHIIITGGSNLYLESLIKNYELNKAKSRSEIDYFINMNYDQIYDYLYQNDPDEAIKITKYNQRRIIRAAQLFYETKLTKQNQNKNNHLLYDVFFINTCLPRKMIYQKIDARVEQMIKNNWLFEVKELYEKDPNIINLQALQAIGYQEILNTIINGGEIDIETIKRKTRNYAKRQITWNKRYNAYNFNMMEDNYLKLLEKVNNFLGGKND